MIRAPLAAFGTLTGLLLAVGPAPAAFAQMTHRAPPPVAAGPLSLQGRVAHLRTFTAADLQRMASTTVVLRTTTEHGVRQASYTGELLLTLLDGAGLVDEPGPKTHLRHTFVARGSDGYAVALSMGELDPSFEGKPVIVAYAQDGKPTSDLRLIVPDDKRAGRDVRNLVSIEVR